MGKNIAIAVERGMGSDKPFVSLLDGFEATIKELPDVGERAISETEKAKLKGVRTLVVNALRDEEHYSHFTFFQAIEFVNEIKPERAYFIHMSHQAGLHQERQKLLPEGMFLAHDGLKIEV
jgi:phosphoribosyl 1,2-cyclic phosphodiesterase